MAKDLGFHGIEVRGLGDDIFAVNARPFTDAQLPKTVEKLNSLGLEIPCLASGCGLKFKEDYDRNISEITQYIVLAKKLGTPYIRVLGDLHPQPEGEVADEFVEMCIRDSPTPVKREGTIDELTESLWGSLNEENKVSLFVRYIDLETGEAETRIVNKNK